MLSFLVRRMILFATYTEAYVNIALNKSAYQENEYSPIKWGAALAVDGRYTDRSAAGNQCTISANKKRTATLRVDLGGVVSISHINIYYRTENAPSPGNWYHRFAGFYLYVSNTTSRNAGHLCFHEIQTVDRTPTEDQRINCSIHGRYVIYYNERRPDVSYPSYYSEYAYNELCELEVYGCLNSAYYGEICNKSCPVNCLERKCDVMTGDCLGCVPGYQGPRCSQVCNQLYYGQGCSSSCGYCSNGDTCHHVNGTCLNGCNEGVEGDNCQNACQTGYYGRDCRHVCSENCGVTKQCNRFTGKCDGCCQKGWKGIRCEQSCQEGSFGRNCDKNCQVYCGGNESCDPITGFCHSGCKDGWNGPLCSQAQKDACTIPDVCDFTLTISSLVAAISIVVIGSVINVILWKRNQPTNTKKEQSVRQKNQIIDDHYTENPSSGDKFNSAYAELEDISGHDAYENLRHCEEKI